MTEEMREPDSVRPLLTLAIPTFNRARYLNELLSTLFDQLRNEPRVELIVSDNASPDETPSVIEEYRQRGLGVRYMRNETNIGADANFLQCFEQASAKYVWIFGDDDVLAAGAIRKILAYLEVEEYDLVYVNSYLFKGSYMPKAARESLKPTRYVDSYAFARRINVFFTFIGGNIINRERVLASNQTDLSALVGTSLVQLGWTYAALNGFALGLYFNEKLVGMRTENTGGYKLLEVFGTTFRRVTDQWLHPEALSRAVVNGAIQRFWPGILLAYRKSSERFTDQASARVVLTPVFGDNVRYWVFLYPAIVLPLTLAKCWLLAVRAVNRIDRAFGYFLLK
jgi:glycosyltransferase involved in cell wall biosynthesis